MQIKSIRSVETTKPCVWGYYGDTHSTNSTELNSLQLSMFWIQFRLFIYFFIPFRLKYYSFHLMRATEYKTFFLFLSDLSCIIYCIPSHSTFPTDYVVMSCRELAYQIAEQFRVLGKPLGLRDCIIVGGMGKWQLILHQTAVSFHFFSFCSNNLSFTSADIAQCTVIYCIFSFYVIKLT